MRMPSIFARCLTIGFCGMQLLLAAQPYPTQYFRSPLDIPLKLSGTFGELRTNHFHSGLDIRTNSVEGLPVYAAAEGHISRVKVSAYGYGLALYIDHPNGYTTVYAHLRNFDQPIADWVEKKHHEKKSFELDIALYPGELPVTKGQRIAFSGNTGGSGGPHLHFEVRDTKSEAVINPRHFGFSVKDQVAPVIDFVEVVPYSLQSQINGSRLPRKLPLQRSAGNNYATATVPTVYGPVYLQIKTWDKHTSNEFRNGIYQLVMRSGNDTLYHFRADRFEFDETRYANAVMDYEARMLQREQIYRCFRSPGNLLSMLPPQLPSALIELNPGETKPIEITVSDFDGNTATSRLSLKGAEGPMSGLQETQSTFTERVVPTKAWTWQNDEVQLNMPAKNLYDTLNFVYRRSIKPYAMFSSVHSLHHPGVPVHASYDLAIKHTGLVDSLRNKTVLVNININKGRSATTGKWDGPWFRSKVRGLGDFYLAVDTVAPVIKISALRVGGSYSKDQQIRFVLADNLSGLQSYNLYLGDTWQKATFDGKTATLAYTFTESSPKGNLILRLIVKDAVGNETTYQTEINSL